MVRETYRQVVEQIEKYLHECERLGEEGPRLEKRFKKDDKDSYL